MLIGHQRSLHVTYLNLRNAKLLNMAWSRQHILLMFLFCSLFYLCDYYERISLDRPACAPMAAAFPADQTKPTDLHHRGTLSILAGTVPD